MGVTLGNMTCFSEDIDGSRTFKSVKSKNKKNIDFQITHHIIEDFVYTVP